MAFPVNQAVSQELFPRADGDGVIRVSRQFPPAVLIQQQIVALQQDDLPVHRDGILHRIVKQAVINRPAAVFPGRDPPYRGKQLLQIKSHGSPLDLHHTDCPAVPFRRMLQQVFLPPVKPVHADGLHRAQPRAFPGQPLQEAGQGALSRSGRRRQQYQDPLSRRTLHPGQLFQQRHEDLIHRLLAVTGSHLYSVNQDLMLSHGCLPRKPSGTPASARTVRRPDTPCRRSHGCAGRIPLPGWSRSDKS